MNVTLLYARFRGVQVPVAISISRNDFLADLRQGARRVIATHRRHGHSTTIATYSMLAQLEAIAGILRAQYGPGRTLMGIESGSCFIPVMDQVIREADLDESFTPAHVLSLWCTNIAGLLDLGILQEDDANGFVTVSEMQVA